MLLQYHFATKQLALQGQSVYAKKNWSCYGLPLLPNLLFFPQRYSYNTLHILLYWTF